MNREEFRYYEKLSEEEYMDMCASVAYQELTEQQKVSYCRL